MFNAFHQEQNSDKTLFVMIVGINALLGKLDTTEKMNFTNLISEAKKDGNIRIIIVDTIEAIKNINFEPWFKGNTDLAEGIWLGNGISNQFTLKVTTNSRTLRAEVEPGFGYVIKKGKAALTKLISDD